jgi:hypothetical protein
MLMKCTDEILAKFTKKGIDRDTLRQGLLDGIYPGKVVERTLYVEETIIPDEPVVLAVVPTSAPPDPLQPLTEPIKRISVEPVTKEPTLKQQADDAENRAKLLKFSRMEKEEQGLRDKPDELKTREDFLNNRAKDLDEREQKLDERDNALQPKETALFKMKKDIEVQNRANNEAADVKFKEIAKREAEIQKVGDYKAQLAQLLLDLQEASHNIDVQKELARQYVSRFCGYAIVFSQKSLRRGAYEYFQLLGEGLSAEQWCEVAVQNMSEAHPDWGDYIGYTYFECVAPLPDGVNIQEMKKLLLDQIERKVKTKILFVRQG